MVICLFLCVCRQSCGYAYGKLRRFARYAGAVAEVIGRVKRCLDIGDRQVQADFGVIIERCRSPVAMYDVMCPATPDKGC